jgi:hypothetical protein
MQTPGYQDVPVNGLADLLAMMKFLDQQRAARA